MKSLRKIIILTFLLSACSSAAPSQPVSQATSAPAKPVEAAKPTSPPAKPTDAPKPTAAPTIAKVGERAESAGLALTVSKVERKKDLDVISKAKAGNVFVVADVLIENTAKDKAPYNTLYFKVKSGDGYEYNAAITALPNQLKSGDLTTGDKVRGIVAFEVPEGAKGLVVSYEPLVILGGYKPIRVALD